MRFRTWYTYYESNLRSVPKAAMYNARGGKTVAVKLYGCRAADHLLFSRSRHVRVVYLPVAVVETLEGLEQVFNMALHKVPKWRREQQEEAWQLHCVAVTRPYRMKYIDDLREIADAARVYGPRYWTDQRARELVAKMLLERLGLVIPVGLTVLDYLPVTHSDKDALSWVS